MIWGYHYFWKHPYAWWSFWLRISFSTWEKLSVPPTPIWAIYYKSLTWFKTILCRIQDSLTKPPVGVTSAEVAINCPDPNVTPPMGGWHRLGVTLRFPWYQPTKTDPSSSSPACMGGPNSPACMGRPNVLTWNIWIKFTYMKGEKWPNNTFRGNMGVSKNSGTPKSSIWIGFSIINHPF